MGTLHQLRTPRGLSYRMAPPPALARALRLPRLGPRLPQLEMRRLPWLQPKTMNYETPLMQRVRLAASTDPDVVLFRNNVGLFYTKDGTPMRCGLRSGAADLIGWKSVVITQSLVGARLAVFAAIEVKTPTGRLRPEQNQFLEIAAAAGALAGVARAAQDAQDILAL